MRLHTVCVVQSIDGTSPIAATTTRQWKTIMAANYRGEDQCSASMDSFSQMRVPWQTYNDPKKVGFIHLSTPSSPYRNRSAVPTDTFSLDFPFSQGSHAGDSGILQGYRRRPSWSERDFMRLSTLADRGVLTKKAIGKFIAQNIRRDKSSKYVGHGSVTGSLSKTVSLFGSVFNAWATSTPETSRRAVSDLTRLLAVDNVAGSSGEFALFTALVAGRRDGRDGSVLYVDELRNAFQNKVLPSGWETWPKSRWTWAQDTTLILGHAYFELGFGKSHDFQSQTCGGGHRNFLWRWACSREP